MLPEHVSLIFLSATTPNTFEFGDWVGRTKRKKVYIVGTSKRPVPLQHYLLHDNDFYRLMRGDTGFDAAAVSLAVRREKEKSMPKAPSADAVKAASSRALEKATNAQVASGRKGPVVVAKDKAVHKTAVVTNKPSDVGGSKSQWLTLLNVLRQGGREEAGGLGAVDFGVGVRRRNVARMEAAGYERWERLPAEVRAVLSRKEYESMHVRESEEEEEADPSGMLPVVVFSFSKRRCEEIADYCRGTDLLSAREQAEVRAVMGQVRSRLNPLDAQLPQVVRVQDLLLRGVGVHHGGLLPLLKEAVELLFSRSVVKVLLATETFAMGVNMPVREAILCPDIAWHTLSLS
jgi:antiviral helicase SKI2